MKKALLLPLFPLLLSGGSCDRSGSAVAGNPYYRGRDLAGREIVLARPANRIVSLAPSNTEIVFALEAGGALAGVTNACDYPEAAAALPRLGDLGRISLEKIASLAPDLVLASSRTDDETLSILGSLGIPAAVTEGTTFAEAFASIVEIGRMTGRDDKARALVADMKARTEAIAARTRGAARPLCYYAVGFGETGNWTAGPGSFIHEMIELAGGRNAGTGIGRPWGLIRIEAVIALDPDLVLVGRHAGSPEALRREPGFSDLPAVKAGRLIAIDDDLVNRPGPRLVQGLREIARAVHPEIFGGETP